MFDPRSSAAATAASCTWLCAGILQLLSASVHAHSKPAPEAVADVAMIRDGGVSAAVERATRGARRRLEQEDCAEIVGDFATVSGRPLRDVLAELQLTPGAALSRVIFREGRESAACRGAVAAFTGPGSRVVFICGSRFPAIDRARTELIVIHELLHTLGVGELPPRSSEIDQAVAVRCG